MQITSSKWETLATIRFGLDIPSASLAGSDPIGDARAAEAAGFDSVSANDHIHATGPRHELWTLMSWIASSTTRVRVASRVMGAPFRNPAIVAKMAETFDRLSGGRLILGLGAGALDGEIRALGVDVLPLRQRVDGLEEAIRITRGVWSPGPFTLDGRVHRTDAVDIEPKPAHHIPIWLGTGGPRGLAMVGRLADGWIPSIENVPPHRAVEMIDQIKRAAEAAGRDPAALTLAYNIQVRIGPGAEADPDLIAGSAEAIAARLIEFTHLGFNAFNLIPVGPDREDHVARLGSDVLPAVRGAT